MEVLEALGWERGGSAEHWEAAGPVGCRADLFMLFLEERGKAASPWALGAAAVCFRRVELSAPNIYVDGGSGGMSTIGREGSRWSISSPYSYPPLRVASPLIS